jgi:phosphotransferase system HPr-like phosphotransfer protein
MNKIKVVLDTTTDVTEFVNLANTIEEDVFLEDGKQFRADAKSLMGVMYGKFEFKELYVISESDIILNKFNKFIA